MDIVALFPIVILPITGILTIPEALAGFSDSSVILIATLFIIGEGLVRTGIAFRLGDWLINKAGNNESRLLLFLMAAVATLGSVMSSTGVVAIFLPVVMNISSRLRIAPGRLMMPLSFAGLISGMMTLVATPPNMVVDSALRRENLGSFDFFSFTPFGVVILLMGIGYMLIARRWLVVRDDPGEGEVFRRNFRHLSDDYKLKDKILFLQILPHSPIAGKLLQEMQLRSLHKINILGAERQERFRKEFFVPHGHTEMKAGDILIVHAPILNPDADSLWTTLGLKPIPPATQGDHLTGTTHELGMAEIILPPDSQIVGQSITSLHFRSKYDLNVIGLRRKRQAVENDLIEEVIHEGDTLLVFGSWNSIRKLQLHAHDFVLLTLPAEADKVAPALQKAPFALLSVFIMVVLMVTGIVPNVIAAFIGCLLMGLFGCLTADSAYKSINWPSLVLIAGMIPFAIALERTGGINMAVDALMNMLGGYSPYILLIALFMLTAVIGLFVSNTATAILMAPIALTIAQRAGSSPLPFAMIVALAASSAFMTPVSSPVNTLVMVPGRYRFGDYVKIGVPFTILVMIVSVFLVPLLFPFKAKSNEAESVTPQANISETDNTAESTFSF